MVYPIAYNRRFPYTHLIAQWNEGNSYATCLKIAKRSYSLIAKNASDRNWRLVIKENRQKLYSKWFEMKKSNTHQIS